MGLVNEENDGIETWENVVFRYRAALKKVTLEMEILNDEFEYLREYNPIEHIKSRLKEPESIVKKLKRNGHESTIENMVKHVSDIAGVRIICSFTSDIYTLAEMIAGLDSIKVIQIQDYISRPKPSGYMSYHMLVSTPVSVNGQEVDTPVEIQIRTVAMDFWASLEHKIQYKFEGDNNTPMYISNDLLDCAKIVRDLDARMLALNKAIQESGTEE